MNRRQDVHNSIRNYDIFDCDILALPIVHNNHITLVVADSSMGTITHYDSLDDGKREYTIELQKFLQEHWEWRIGHGGYGLRGEYTMTNRWLCQGQPKALTPQQRDGLSCGVFTLAFATLIFSRLPIQVFNHALVPSMRCFIANCLLTGHSPVLHVLSSSGSYMSTACGSGDGYRYRHRNMRRWNSITRPQQDVTVVNMVDDDEIRPSGVDDAGRPSHGDIRNITGNKRSALFDMDDAQAVTKKRAVELSTCKGRAGLTRTGAFSPSNSGLGKTRRGRRHRSSAKQTEVAAAFDSNDEVMEGTSPSLFPGETGEGQIRPSDTRGINVKLTPDIAVLNASEHVIPRTEDNTGNSVFRASTSGSASTARGATRLLNSQAQGLRFKAPTIPIFRAGDKGTERRRLLGVQKRTGTSCTQEGQPTYDDMQLGLIDGERVTEQMELSSPSLSYTAAVKDEVRHSASSDTIVAAEDMYEPEAFRATSTGCARAVRRLKRKVMHTPNVHDQRDTTDTAREERLKRQRLDGGTDIVSPDGVDFNGANPRTREGGNSSSSSSIPARPQGRD